MYTYKLTLTIYPIADCGEDLNKGEPLEAIIEGNNVFEMKSEIDYTILATMKAHKANDGVTFVEMDIEKDGEYYDHDEQTVWVNLQTDRVVYGFDNELCADLLMEQREQM